MKCAALRERRFERAMEEKVDTLLAKNDDDDARYEGRGGFRSNL